MNKEAELKAQLLLENSKSNANYISQLIKDDEEQFMMLWEFIKNENPPLSSRSAWVLENVCSKYPYMVCKILDEMIELLQETDNVAIKRHVLKVLTYTEIPEIYLGRIFDFCIRILESHAEAIAAKAYSMQILFNISEIEPGLKAELTSIFENQLIENSSGIKARALILLKKLNKQVDRGN